MEDSNYSNFKYCKGLSDNKDKNYSNNVKIEYCDKYNDENDKNNYPVTVK